MNTAAQSLSYAPLVYQKTSGYKYRVAQDAVLAAPELAGLEVEHRWFRIRDAEIVVRAGYAWDGASGPTLDTPATMRGGLAHDVVYQAIRAGLLDPKWKPVADAMLRRMMLDYSDSLWGRIRAGYYYQAVSLFGGSAIKPRTTEDQDKLYAV